MTFYETINCNGIAKSRKSPPPWRGRVRVGVISCRISVCYFPLPLVPSRRGRGKFTFYETINNNLDSNYSLWGLWKDVGKLMIKERMLICRYWSKVFVGGEMEGGRKFVGMQCLTFNVDLRQVWESSTNTLEFLSNVKGRPQSVIWLVGMLSAVSFLIKEAHLSCIWTNVPTFYDLVYFIFNFVVVAGRKG